MAAAAPGTGAAATTPVAIFSSSTSTSCPSLFSPLSVLSPSLPVRRLRLSLPSPSRSPIVVRSGPSGGGFGGSDGGSRGGGGDGGENGDSGEKNRAEALLVLAEADRTLESLPKDLSAAIENGRVPGLIVQRFFELEKSPVFRWLLQFGGLKERLLGDDLFLTKVAIECGVGIFTKVLPSTPCLMVVLPKRSLRDGGGHFCLLIQRILSTLIEALTKQL